MSVLMQQDPMIEQAFEIAAIAAGKRCMVRCLIIETQAVQPGRCEVSKRST
jgi:hypothetical protein